MLATRKAFHVSWIGLALCATAHGQETGHGETPPGVGRLAVHAVVLESPLPQPSGRFGQCCELLDFDGDGALDVAIGASGERRAYVALGAGPRSHAHFRKLKSLLPEGGEQAVTDSFGMALAGGDLDGDLADELAIGEPEADGLAGAVHVYGLGAPGDPPLVLRPEPGMEGSFGWSLATGDFDGDGIGDLAVSAPRALVDGVPAGRVQVFYGPLRRPAADTPADSLDEPSESEEARAPRTTILDNLHPIENGAFGHDLEPADLDADGHTDLVVAAPGNASEGVQLAGQVFVFSGPPRPGLALVLEDPDPDPEDPSRFGMDVATYGQIVSVGSPRKNTSMVDTGQGFVFRNPGSGPLTTHRHPEPQPADILGYRSALADVLGGPRPDALFVSLHRKGLLAWDGTRLGDPPRMIPVLPDSGDHFAQGIATGQLFPGGRDELILGDPTWDRPDLGQHDDVGRVVVYYRTLE